MKKIGIIITAVTLSVLICALGAFAAGPNRPINTNDEEGEVQTVLQTSDPSFNETSTTLNFTYCPADGTGFQYGANNHNIFVDQDGDGICDQAGSTCYSSNCIGNQYRVNCQNQFIDQNNDGVCDRIDAQERGEKLGYQYRNGIKK